MDDTQVVPVVSRSAPAFDRGDQWSEDRTGRFVLLGLVFAAAFLLVAAALWWASGGNRARTAALAGEASTIAPDIVPATVVDTAAEDGALSTALTTLPLSSYPLPARGLVIGETPTTTQPAPATAQPTVPPATLADTTTTAATPPPAPTTTVVQTTTSIAATTTLAPTTVVASLAPAATTPSTTTATTTPATTTPATTTPATTTPATTVPGPVVTSPASPDATLLDVVTNTPDLSRVRQLVEMSGFQSELDAARPLTLLAPSNAAVDAWAATPEGQAVLADPDAVYDLLLRHLVPEALDEATIFTRTSLDTVSGAQLGVLQDSHTVGGADLLVVDVTAANGYLDVISDVLA